MWNAWFRRRRWEQSLDAELRFHLEQMIEDSIAAGLSPDEARRRARRDLGSFELAKDECRDQRPFPWLADAAADARFALRTFARAPGFTAVAVVTLALGIGANTAMFTLFHRVLVQMLPVTQPERLVELGCVNANEPDKVGCRASYPAFQMYRDNNQVLSGLFAFAPTSDLNVIHLGGAELTKGLLATGDMYTVLGVTPALGRLFNPADDAPSAPPVLSHAYWQRRFGGDPRVIGQSVRINTQVATVIGVTPAAFRGVTLGEPAEITLAMGSGASLFHGARSLENGANQWLRMIGRRKPGVSIQQVEAALTPIFQRTVDHLISSIPTGMESRARAYFSRVQFQVQPAAAGGASSFRRDLDRPLRTLMAAVGAVLLMACVNLASLLLSRAAGRRREFGIRLAIGAGAGRLIRQFLTETLLISVTGAVLGVAIAQVSGPVLLKMASGEIGLQAIDLTPDLTVLFFTSAMALLAGVLMSIGPILHIRNADPQNPMRDGNQKRAASKLARSLIPAQVALATLVLIGAGLLLRTFENFARVDLGFRSENRITFTVSPGLVGYDTTRAKSFFSDLTDASMPYRACFPRPSRTKLWAGSGA